MRKSLDKLLLAALLMMALSTNGQEILIKTVAGSGTPGTGGFSGDNAHATAALLHNPIGVFVDAAGNIYIADNINNRVRKVTKTTGIITTIAGNGTPGYSGDGHAATAAELYGPTAITEDAAGNLYVADNSNNCIRKISTSGIISTIAGQGPPATAGFGGDGGPASAASFSNPVGIAIDASGNIYIADENDARVRVIESATGNISTIAGTGMPGYSDGPATDCKINIPTAVCVDASGNVYIADQGNSLIRKVSGGMISTVAGTNLLAAGYAGDGGSAVAAQLNYPYGVAVDKSGNIFIADAGNQVIRKVTATSGDISTYVSCDTAHSGFRGDGGLATGAELSTPQGIAVDTAGNLYIADAGNERIREVYSKSTVGVQQFISPNGSISLFPDPNNGTFTINGTLHTITDEKVSLAVTDVLGRVVYKNDVPVHQGMIQTQVALQSTLPDGCYLLNVRSASENELVRFVIQR